MGSDHIEVVDSYQYLGIKLKPSGSMQYAVGELYDKASRAWFAISNVFTNINNCLTKANFL